MNAIEADALTLRYGGRTALDSVALAVRAGEIFGLLGPNGGGKTSLFRILATMVPPSGGRALVFGADVAREPDAVRRSIGVVFQSPSLDGKLSAFENLKHQARLYGLPAREIAPRIREMLGRFGLSDRARERVERFSGGMRRRVEIAKGLLHRPRLLLLDEPSTGLDPGARRDLWTELQALRAREGVTAFLTTHLMEEAERCDRLAILDRGRLVALGTPGELKSLVGGEIVTIGAADAEGLRGGVRARFGVEGTILEGRLRYERPDAAAFLRALLEAFPGAIDSFSVGKPSLEDVFIAKTGHRFWSEAG